MPKTKKDPNKPKGVKSAYIFFVESERHEQDARGEQLPFSEFSKQCGIAWGKMDDSEKEQFVKMSERDRKRHENEMRNYQPPPPSYDSDSDDEGATRKKKKKKDPNAPKRPITAYFFFASDVRPQIRKENPDLAITEIASLIGQQWRGLTSADKKEYEASASKDKERYDREMAAYHRSK